MFSNLDSALYDEAFCEDLNNKKFIKCYNKLDPNGRAELYNYLSETLNIEEDGTDNPFLGMNMIPTSFFMGATDLISIVIPNGIKIIDFQAFRGCSNLTDIVIPKSVKMIEDLAFADCYNISTITYLGTEANWRKIELMNMWDANTPAFKIKFSPINESIDITQSEQEFTSADTSINSSKLPAIFNMVKFEPDTINLDYGGGKFDNATEHLKKLSVDNLIYDPFNRPEAHNRHVLEVISNNGGADTATLSNVLNVIKEPSVRLEVLSNIKKLLKPNGVLYITVYEGDGSSESRPTKKGYQLNKKTSEYVSEVSEIFRANSVEQKGKLIKAIR